MMNEYRAYAQEVAQRYGIPTELFLNLVTQESSWNPQAVSPKGAVGLTQLMPGTAGDLGVDPTDWRQNLEGGARYLKQQVDRFQSWPRALAAYNAGPRRVAESGGIPNIKETRNYIDRIMAGYRGGSEIAKDAMAALGQGGASMTPQAMQGLLAQDAAATAQPMPARQATDYGNLLDALAIGFSGMTLRPNEGLARLAQERIKGRREQAQRNATADWLESQGMTQYADAVRQGTIGGAEALKLARGGEATAAQRNYEFLIGQGVDPETAMQRAFGSGGTTINMPGQMERVGDQILIADPNSPAGVRLVDIPGGKASAEAQAEVERAARAAEQRGVQRSVVADSVDYLVGQLDKSGKRLFDLPEAGIVGGALAGMGINQEAVDFRNQLRSLQATIAFDTLAQMREASKTGGALGAVSERELDLLMNALGNIDQTTSPDLLRRNLNTIKDIMTKIENDPVARGFYYGNAQGAGGQAQPQTSTGGVTVGEPY